MGYERRALLVIRCCRASLLAGALCAGVAADGNAQQIEGRVLDAATGQPVHTAGVFLLAEDRTRVAMAIDWTKRPQGS